MATVSAQDIRTLIERHRSVARFGTAADAVDPAWVAKAESALARPLPNSYKWFLENYAGGEIGGEEIYSLYGMDFETVNGGDIVFQHLANRRAGVLSESQLVVSETDLGEVFFFDYSQFKDGESPILQRLPSGDNVPYAENFYEFLAKRIEAHR
jgi:antitoxin YobK